MFRINRIITDTESIYPTYYLVMAERIHTFNLNFDLIKMFNVLEYITL